MLNRRVVVGVKLTVSQRRRLERIAPYLWPGEQLDEGELARRLLLEHLLWAEDERRLVGKED